MSVNRCGVSACVLLTQVKVLSISKTNKKTQDEFCQNGSYNKVNTNCNICLWGDVWSLG